MTAPPVCATRPPPTAETLFRAHIREMHKYANELAAVLGADSPIVKRINSCAMSNRDALGAISATCAECGKAA